MNQQKAKKALKTYFGYDSFRPLQAEIIQKVYDQEDSLVLMPTGGGKSICYQIPAITSKGTTLVISPLISLMKDQVDGLQSNGIRAAFLNSSQAPSEQDSIIEELLNAKIKLLYLSPEKLCSQSFQPILTRLTPNLIAIDEAHCISAWGHDFRPEYTQLSFLKRIFPNSPVMALTATADKTTRKDILKQLGIPKANTFISSFDRPNISLEVLPGQKRIEKIIDFIEARPNQSGIIYALSRKSTESIAAKLQSKGINAAHYHAGLSPLERSNVQQEFINDSLPIVCATVAFGMGIDKSNVRWVIHYNMPKNIESYYQEIGRAGRDGSTASALLFYSYNDMRLLHDMLTKDDSQQIEVKLAKLNRMKEFAEALTCRRKVLLNYFSEYKEEKCNNCDVCKNPPKEFDGTIVAQKALSAVYRLKSQVGMQMLIDVLRGSKRKEITSNDFHKIKTFGAGAEFSVAEWQYFIMQLLHQGLLEIAYDKNNLLQPTKQAHEVLFNQKKVTMSRLDFSKKSSDSQSSRPTKTSTGEELFQNLRKLRRTLAQKKGIPPYLIFTDTTLQEMAKTKPTTAEDIFNISGMTKKKYYDYGKIFLREIRSFLLEKSEAGKKLQGSTYIITQNLLEKGYSVPAIAQERGIHENTVFSHIAYLYKKGEPLKLTQWIKQKELLEIGNHLQSLSSIPPLKEIYTHFDNKYTYPQIRLAIAYYEKHQH